MVAEPRFDLGDSPLVNPSWQAIHLCRLQKAARKKRPIPSHAKNVLLMMLLPRILVETHGPGGILGTRLFGKQIKMSLHVSWLGSVLRILEGMVGDHHGRLTGLRMPVAGVEHGWGK